ncbi:hypothetical protein DPMN_151718 [Dreissena polymorpha]|uniref:Uncharacterized protein n=1 Tax=Dreissena polymorpha TaxID=45954 RepID=A0A9D4FFW5_DREPO|nr:hypothetical protein DPMN_151718 [Dreissena polymorpha]
MSFSIVLNTASSISSSLGQEARNFSATSEISLDVSDTLSVATACAECTRNPKSIGISMIPTAAPTTCRPLAATDVALRAEVATPPPAITASSENSDIAFPSRMPETMPFSALKATDHAMVLDPIISLDMKLAQSGKSVSRVPAPSRSVICLQSLITSMRSCTNFLTISSAFLRRCSLDTFSNHCSACRYTSESPDPGTWFTKIHSLYK